MRKEEQSETKTVAKIDLTSRKEDTGTPIKTGNIDKTKGIEID